MSTLDFLYSVLERMSNPYPTKKKNPKMIIVWNKENNNVQVFLSEEAFEMAYRDDPKYDYVDGILYEKEYQDHPTPSFGIFDNISEFTSQVWEENSSSGYFSHAVKVFHEFYEALDDLNIELYSLD